MSQTKNQAANQTTPETMKDQGDGQLIKTASRQQALGPPLIFSENKRVFTLNIQPQIVKGDFNDHPNDLGAS